jgi:hypothetical protein
MVKQFSLKHPLKCQGWFQKLLLQGQILLAVVAVLLPIIFAEFGKKWIKSKFAPYIWNNLSQTISEEVFF